jgi:hypothetical protein
MLRKTIVITALTASLAGNVYLAQSLRFSRAALRVVNVTVARLESRRCLSAEQIDAALSTETQDLATCEGNLHAIRENRGTLCFP